MSNVFEEETQTQADVDADEDETVDEEAVARFWGAPRFATPGIPADDETFDDNDTKETPDEYYIEEEQEYLFGHDPERISFPESTHTLFFLYPKCSLPFLYALCIAFITIACLIMAFINALDAGSPPDNIFGVPPNVSWPVKMAQYLGILIALLMEEEIPTALQLLRVITRAAFEEKFPYHSYNLFFASAMLRIAVGLLFLVNACLIIVQSTSVLEIFFDVLALQFVSSLDDIAFRLCKMDIMGVTLRHACSARLYQEEFEKQEFRRSRLEVSAIRSTYLFELLLFMAGMTVITINQNRGEYQCQEIKVDFGDGLWEDPVVLIDGNFMQGFTLVFSYFNGVYKQLDGDTHDGRPVYTEMKKFDSTDFDEVAVRDEGTILIQGAVSSVIPAKIKYSKDTNSWILTHPFIKQHNDDDYDSETWMLRSPQTDDFELLTVSGEWDMWTGRIESTTVKISCNKCSDDSDCNLNGICGQTESGKCDCNNNGNITYLGTDCGVRLEDKCETIITEDNSFIYGVQYISTFAPQANVSDGAIFQQYGHPTYFQIKPVLEVDDSQWLLYTGSRWFEGFTTMDSSLSNEEILRQISNFHGFWSKAYSGSTQYVSDPSTKDGPVGVDFYIKGEENNETTNQFGPFGALTPLQKDGQTGRGVWRCAGPLRDFNPF